MKRQIFSHYHPCPKMKEVLPLTSILHIIKSLGWVAAFISSLASRLCKLWLHDFLASSAFSWLNSALARRGSLGFHQSLPPPAPPHCAALASEQPHSSPIEPAWHTRWLERPAGREESSSAGCQAICLTWLLKSMTVCGAQVWSDGAGYELYFSPSKWSLIHIVCPHLYRCTSVFLFGVLLFECSWVCVCRERQNEEESISGEKAAQTQMYEAARWKLCLRCNRQIPAEKR